MWRFKFVSVLLIISFFLFWGSCQIIYIILTHPMRCPSWLMLKYWVLMIYGVLGPIRIEVLALIEIEWQRNFFYLYFLDMIQSFLEFWAFYIVEDSLRVTFVESFIFLAPRRVSNFFFNFAIRGILEEQIKFRVILAYGWCLPVLMLVQILERIFSWGNTENEVTLNWSCLLFKIGFVI
jgi:hypothetical protein